ncbi:DUF3955 domain-containing protein [Erysipelothrix inopinata]|uniref:DUF3955 domain-containing protein n=2 Tax=Erysipelothrix inopinata TaxID=225084 RepID=A0A7G9S1U8_9FIRM|nr:DUF3955 domain-containing protein [Erysipelothrix inopinata]
MSWHVSQGISYDTKKRIIKMKKLYNFTIGLILLGFILLAIKSASPEYIDEQGILHETFYLIGLGTFSILGGTILTIINAIVIKLRKKTTLKQVSN